MGMIGRFRITGKKVRLGFALAAMVAVAACPATGFGAERMVLGEYFNATW
jgi:hypothetical protein